MFPALWFWSVSVIYVQLWALGNIEEQYMTKRRCAPFDIINFSLNAGPKRLICSTLWHPGDLLLIMRASLICLAVGSSCRCCNRLLLMWHQTKWGCRASASSHHVGDAPDGLGVQHDDLGGHVSLHGLRHVLHRAVDGRVFDLEPVVGVPADQEPHVLLSIELLFENLQTVWMEGRVRMKN